MALESLELSSIVTNIAKGYERPAVVSPSQEALAKVGIDVNELPTLLLTSALLLEGGRHGPFMTFSRRVF